mgnify:CR=1 FL=1
MAFSERSLPQCFLLLLLAAGARSETQYLGLAKYDSLPNSLNLILEPTTTISIVRGSESAGTEIEVTLVAPDVSLYDVSSAAELIQLSGNNLFINEVMISFEFSYLLFIHVDSPTNNSVQIEFYFFHLTMIPHSHNSIMIK